MAFWAPPDSVLDAFEDAAGDLGLARFSRTPTELLAANPGEEARVLRVLVRDSADVSVAEIRYTYTLRPMSGEIALPVAIPMQLGLQGLRGAARAQERAGPPADRCPSTREWARTDLPFEARGEATREDREPVLIGGLAGLQERVDYPEAARRAGISGVVLVRFIVGESGEVQCAEVISGLPGGLNEAALSAVVESRFEPGILSGQAVPVRFVVPVSFWSY